MFSEQAYLQAYPDVAKGVNDGVFSSGLQHYTQYGQFDQKRIGFFFGSSGNDTLTGIGEGNKLLAGVAFDALSNGSTVAGVGEVDTLIGTARADLFVLGHPSLAPLTSTSQKFYVGGGNTDYARIQNFKRWEDVILLEGSPQDYNLQVVNGSTNISTASGDLVGIVEGVAPFLPLGLFLSNSLNSISTIANLNIPLDATGSFSVII
ncbi:hypothetical protein [Nostoc favosum]|uniref:Uncharacterized protein n=1 Tax=Nostoc favosum CHAB5714 TaxID=2780399 RepID=A0ABS8IGV1_9NOSO|nr:hypothetical protein [Nostoc favosum]MCC5603043.1 hypothetical protein [Nostoc favosum CHAB5714]